MNNIFTKKELMLIYINTGIQKSRILKELEADEKDLEEIRERYSLIGPDDLREKNEILDHENLQLDIINSKKEEIKELEVIENKIVKEVDKIVAAEKE